MHKNGHLHGVRSQLCQRWTLLTTFSKVDYSNMDGQLRLLTTPQDGQLCQRWTILTHFSKVDYSNKDEQPDCLQIYQRWTTLSKMDNSYLALIIQLWQATVSISVTILTSGWISSFTSLKKVKDAHILKIWFNRYIQTRFTTLRWSGMFYFHCNALLYSVKSVKYIHPDKWNYSQQQIPQ